MLTLTAKTGFDDRVYDDLLDLLARHRAADFKRWRELETERFKAGGGDAFPDRAFRDRITGFIREQSRILDQYADYRAFQVMSGRVLRQALAERPDLLPPEAADRVRLTLPRTAADAELTSLLVIYRDLFPEEHLLWLDNEVLLTKYHEVNGGEAPMTVALAGGVEGNLARAGAFLRAHCWVQSTQARFRASSDFREIMRGAIAPELMVVTDADRHLRIDRPSDIEVLAYLDREPWGAEFKHTFSVTVESRDELVLLIDMTWDVMDSEKAQHWAERRREHGGASALNHATRFRIMKRLNEEAMALEERLRAERRRS